MDFIPPRLLAFCLTVIPLLLVLGGIFGLLGLFSVGPRELPKKHELNRYMSLSFISMGIGIWFSGVEGIFGTLGLIVAFFGLLSYTMLMRQAREEFPAYSQEQWMDIVRQRYKFAGTINDPPAAKSDGGENDEAGSEGE